MLDFFANSLGFRSAVLGVISALFFMAGAWFIHFMTRYFGPEFLAFLFLSVAFGWSWYLWATAPDRKR